MFWKVGIFAFFCALLGSSWAATCLSYPDPTKSGRACKNDFSCSGTLYCSNKEGVCLPRLKVGSDCTEIYVEYSDDPCEEGSTCTGEGFTYKCVADAQPGQDCSRSGSPPRCATGFSSCDQNICRGGNIGDACRVKADCIGQMACTEGTCIGVPIGSACSSTSECVIGSYCDDQTELCVALKTQGTCTGGECAPGYGCLATNSSGFERFCVAYQSLLPGDFCSGNDIYCKDSLRCSGNYCAAHKVKYCSSQSHCAADQYCSCDGNSLSEGVGTCETNPCYKIGEDYDKCFSAKCRSSSFFTGSCVQRNCESAYKKYLNQCPES